VTQVIGAGTLRRAQVPPVLRVVVVRRTVVRVVGVHRAMVVARMRDGVVVRMMVVARVGRWMVVRGRRRQVVGRHVWQRAAAARAACRSSAIIILQQAINHC